MKHSVTLGLRLALGSTGEARYRSLAMSGAALIGTILLLVVAAFARAVWATRDSTVAVDRDGDVLVLALAVLAIALPVATLTATVSRLSAGLRDRRLTNLRLLGMTPGQTRAVAVTEVGVFAVLGWAAGELAFLGVRPLLARVSLGGHEYAVTQLAPPPLDHLLIALAVPGLVVALAALPRRRPGAELVQAGRRGSDRRPGWWRLVPLVVGVGLCWWLTAAPRRELTDDDIGRMDVQVVAMLAGVALLGIGVVLVIPVFVRLVADLLSRAHNHPVALLAGRRLQAQPVAMTRVVSALLIGLFLATGAHGIIGAFESTPQYQRVDRMVTVEQQTLLSAEPDEIAQTATAAESVPGVRDAVPLRWVEADCHTSASMGSMCWTRVFVGTCADLQAFDPGVTGCLGDRVQEVGFGRWVDSSVPPVSELTLWAEGFADDGTGPHGATTVVPLPSGPSIGVSPWREGFFGGAVFVPSSLPDVAELVPQSRAQVLVLADPGRDLFDKLHGAGLSPSSWEDYGEYDSVARMRQLVQALSLVIIAVGTLSFGIAATDRALERRREVISLQLVGAPGRLLRASHWLEIALPLVLGCALAVWLGRLAGETYLEFAAHELGLGISWAALTPMLSAAVGGGIVIGLATSLAANPRIRPELIRAD